MCGIAGSVNFPIPLEKVNEKMGHRGPDASGSFTDGSVQLLHVRLAILDIVGGIQPMTLLDRYTIIFNGEVYNHLEVRKKLQLQCQSNSDTETILAAYIKIGASCLEYFDGMFAFCIYDKLEQTLFAARDRSGKKPFYYYHNGECFVFASELNLLKSILPLEIDNDTIPLYLKFGSCWIGQTPYVNVRELLPGSFAILQKKSIIFNQTKWWDVGLFFDKKEKIHDEKLAITITERLLYEAIERRVESSDLEVGSFLSGGIDSGLVTSIAAQMKPGLRTFTISFDGAFNEAPLAKLVADKYLTKHTEILISLTDLNYNIEKIIAQYGEPFYDSSAIPSWYVSKAASEFLTVILNGDGADELFGGYRRYVPFSKYNFFQSNSVLKILSKGLSSILPPAHNKKTLYNYLNRLIFLTSKTGMDVYAASGSDIFEGSEKQFLFSEKNCYTPLLDKERWLKENKNTGLQQIMQLDFDVTLSCDFLVKMDIATMAHSLEGRSPFLSKDMLEFAPTLADDLKVRGKQTKYLLRRLAEKYLPSELINQPKRGFEVPLKQWVNYELKEIIFDYLGSSNTYSSTFIAPSYINDLITNKIGISEEKRAKQLYTLFALEVWHRKCYLNN